MTLTTHAIVGAAAGSAVFAFDPTLRGMAWGFAAGFASHLIIDTIPHWDEGPAVLRSLRKDPADPLNADMILGKKFLLDVLYLGAEALAGLFIGICVFSFWLFHIPLESVVIGACGGLLPDLLHLVYFKTRLPLLARFERFHHRLQRQYPDVRLLAGEAGLVVAVILLLKLFVA